MTRKRRRLPVFFLLSALLVGAAGWWLADRWLNFADAPIAGIPADSSIVIERGDSLRTVLARLQQAGKPPGDELEWELLARQMGAAGRLHVGEYALPPGITPRRLLQDMSSGKVISHRLTIVDGWNIRQLRAALAKASPLLQASADMSDAQLMDAIGAPGLHPEGQFLPETYLYTRGDSDLDVLKRAHQALNKALDEAWQSRADGLPLESPQQALILASIIEKETGIAEERARIAGVFIRRLQLGMRLQTDPTVIYGMGERYSGRIRRVDLDTDTPYNTYTRAGLTPTPIAMPGLPALRAATQPEPGDSLYFVAVGDGSGRHVFSRTYAEHNVAVRQYVQRLRENRAALQAGERGSSEGAALQAEQGGTPAATQSPSKPSPDVQPTPPPVPQP